MDNKIDQRIRRDQEDRLDRLSSQDHQLSSFPSQPAHTLHSSRNGPITPRPDGPSSGYSLMVAGQATGKTAFLRLLLDTSEIASTTTQDQLASVAKFVQGCAGHTSHIRTVSFDIDLDPPELGQLQSVSLTLTDTPSLDVRDESASERLLSDILRHVETKFSESLEDEYKARIGDHHIHLCIYFLDPDGIIPPSAIRPPAPLLPRTHTNNVSQSDVEPVILEPPVTTNPLLRRPVLPQAEINVIRALSSRVNVLPVIARADTLTNDRLAAIKMAIRHDLAEAGIGFGIFDLDTHPPSNGDNKAFNGLSNGSSSSPGSSSPTSPVTPSFLRLPYALISPDCYSHSDGVNRPALARHELVLQYTPGRPPSPNALPNKLIRGKFTRSYRWGFLDVLDPNHSDFLPLRQAIYHHMQTLQKYTREYLYDKFKMEYMMQHHPGESRAVQVNGPLPPLSNSRPILNIDSPLLHSGLSRHAAITASRQLPVVDAHVPTIHSALSDSGQENNRASTKANRQRAKKITVACNFCRSRKLKCDGGRPACHQCLKRSNACDYMVPQKRRGGMRQRRNLINSDSEGASGDERSVEIEPSASPEAVPKPLARVAPDRELPPLDVIQQQSTFGKHEDMPALKLQQFPQHKSEQVLATSLERRGVPFMDADRPGGQLPPIALSPPSGINASAPPLLASIRAPEETAMSSLSSGHQAPEVATQRKRVPTVSARGNRSSSNYGPKVVACNHCRARKTKCDGGHPTCSSCARRSLTCNYVNDPNVPGGPRRKGSTTASEPASAASSGPVSAGPSSAASVSATGHHIHEDERRDWEGERERVENQPPSKRIRVEGGSTTSTVAVLGIP